MPEDGGNWMYDFICIPEKELHLAASRKKQKRIHPYSCLSETSAEFDIVDLLYYAKTCETVNSVSDLHVGGS